MVWKMHCIKRCFQFWWNVIETDRTLCHSNLNMLSELLFQLFVLTIFLPYSGLFYDHMQHYAFLAVSLPWSLVGQLTKPQWQHQHCKKDRSENPQARSGHIEYRMLQKACLTSVIWVTYIAPGKLVMGGDLSSFLLPSLIFSPFLSFPLPFSSPLSISSSAFPSPLNPAPTAGGVL